MWFDAFRVAEMSCKIDIFRVLFCVACTVNVPLFVVTTCPLQGVSSFTTPRTALTGRYVDVLKGRTQVHTIFITRHAGAKIVCDLILLVAVILQVVGLFCPCASHVVSFLFLKPKVKTVSTYATSIETIRKLRHC